LKNLPQSLTDALDALEADEVIKGALGAIQHEFIKIKRREWNAYHRSVSSWEIEQYLTCF
jgi:glutamine synthetase